MSLTAVTSDLQLYNPSVVIASGADSVAVLEKMRRLQKDGLFCPHCYSRTGSFTPVRYRNSQSKRKHFYHLQAVESAKECRHYSSESEKHLAAKAALADLLLIREGVADVSLEIKRQIDPALPWRKPDITVVLALGQVEAHEIQISYISLEDLKARTNDLKSHGVNRVHWYLHGSAYTREIRLWCHYNNVPRYRLWFESKDEAKPRWQEDSGYPKVVSASKGEGQDQCNYRDYWFPQIGETVHKAHYYGWTGKVVAITNARFCEVLWVLDKHPSMVEIAELRPEHIEFQGYKKGATA